MRIPDNRAGRTPAFFRLPADGIDWLLLGAFGAALLSSLVIFAVTASQPILESFGFRQTQTALTAYWFVHDGFALAYETPVLGYPWPIPLELPLFQAIVALIKKVSSLSLDSIGRGVSFVFFLLALIPVAAICRRLGLGYRVFLIFGSLYLLSPQYLFWGRSFMIESAATFFTLATIAAALPLLRRDTVSLARAVAVVVLASLALTVKITTALWTVAILGLCIVWLAGRDWHKYGASVALRFACRGLLLAVPFALALLWTHYTDVIKAQNEVGKLITSGALTLWNFGTPAQRFVGALYTDVIWRRCLVGNAAGLLGIAVMGYFFTGETRRDRLTLGFALAALFLLPIFTFTNLHLIHNYYQTANVVYVIALLALALVFVLERTSTRFFALAFTLALASNVAYFRVDAWPLAHKRITPENNAVLAAARIVRERSDPEKPILVYGLEWSSELTYYAQRKSLSVPSFYARFEDPLSEPDRYLGTSDVGALVICAGSRTPGEDAIRAFLERYGPFEEAVAQNCRVFVAVKSSPANRRSAARPAEGRRRVSGASLSTRSA